MDALIKEFRTAYTKERGNDLAKTLTPDVTDSGTKLLSVWESGRNAQGIKDDLQFLFVRDKSVQLRMSREEAQGWQEVYLAYWKALGEILAMEGLRRDGAKVRIPSHCLIDFNSKATTQNIETQATNSYTVHMDQGLRILERVHISDHPGLYQS